MPAAAMPAPSACAAARWEGSVPARVPQKTATERICWGMRLSEGCRILPWIGGGPQACQVKILWRNERRPLLALSRRRPSLASWGKTLDLIVPIWTGPRDSWMIRMIEHAGGARPRGAGRNGLGAGGGDRRTAGR